MSNDRYRVVFEDRHGKFTRYFDTEMSLEDSLRLARLTGIRVCEAYDGQNKIENVGI